MPAPKVLPITAAPVIDSPLDSGTFRKLGEAVDMTTSHYERAKMFAQHNDLVAMLTLSLGPKMSFGDGSQQLSNALCEAVRNMLPELVEDALANLRENAELARSELTQAMGGKPATPKQPKAPA